MTTRTTARPAPRRLTIPLATLVEAISDRLHAADDAEARAYGLTVERLPWGRRRIYDPRLAVHTHYRR
jgi:hypothetical protein